MSNKNQFKEKSFGASILISEKIGPKMILVII